MNNSFRFLANSEAFPPFSKHEISNSFPSFMTATKEKSSDFIRSLVLDFLTILVIQKRTDFCGTWRRCTRLSSRVIMERNRLEGTMKKESPFVLTGRQVKGIRRMQWSAKKAGDCRLLLRCQTMLMLWKGLTQALVASILGVHINSIIGWVRRVRECGITGLLDKVYPGATPKLDAGQQATLKKIVENGPEAFGLDTGVWTGPLVREVIRREFGVIYDVSQVRRILHRLGFSVQYPRVRLSKGDKEKQEEWLNTTLPAIKTKVREDKGVLMFEDEVIFQLSGSTTRSWALKGTGNTVDSLPGRTSKKVLGAVTAEENPKFHFRFAPVFNQDTFGAFLKQIIRHHPEEKVHLVLDNVRYHHAKNLKVWLEAHKSRIELHYLPPYSPQFNPIEKVWKVTKKAAIHNRYFEDLDQLHSTIYRRFNRFQGNPASLRGIVRSFVTHKN